MCPLLWRPAQASALCELTSGWLLTCVIIQDSGQSRSGCRPCWCSVSSWSHKPKHITAGAFAFLAPRTNLFKGSLAWLVKLCILYIVYCILGQWNFSTPTIQWLKIHPLIMEWNSPSSFISPIAIFSFLQLINAYFTQNIPLLLLGDQKKGWITASREFECTSLIKTSSFLPLIRFIPILLYLFGCYWNSWFIMLC